MEDKEFIEDLNDSERNIWLSLRGFARTSQEITKAANYREVVQDLLPSYKAMGCNMNLKIHFLESQLEFFPKNLGKVSDDQVKGFTKTFGLWKSGTEASGPQVCWQTVAGH